jgi:hypothetical protein
MRAISQYFTSSRLLARGSCDITVKLWVPATSALAYYKYWRIVTNNEFPRRHPMVFLTWDLINFRPDTSFSSDPSQSRLIYPTTISGFLLMVKKSYNPPVYEPFSQFIVVP